MCGWAARWDAGLPVESERVIELDIPSIFRIEDDGVVTSFTCRGCATGSGQARRGAPGLFATLLQVLVYAAAVFRPARKGAL